MLRQLVGQASLPVTTGQTSLPTIDVGQSFKTGSLTGWKAGLTNAPTTSDGEVQPDTNERLAQLESALLMAGLKPAEAIPLIAPLLNLPASEKYPPPAFPPEQQRRRLLAMLVGWVLGAARAQPLTIVLEDLHWADASTLEVVQLLAEQGLPTGAAKISGRGYQPYLQFPWSHGLAPGWELAGMFTLFWSPSDSSQSLVFQPTLSLEKALGFSADVFVEYVGDYNNQLPAHLLDGGGAWRFSKTQQIDFHAGVGVNRSSPALNGVPVAQYFGIGYSIRLDQLFGGTGVGNAF